MSEPAAVPAAENAEYPETPANQRNEAIRQAWRANIPTLQAAPAGDNRDLGIPTTPMTPTEWLQAYPKTINPEYLQKMTEVIDAAVAANDFTALYAYCETINPRYAVELSVRAKAVEGGQALTPVVTTITGTVTTDNSPADGSTANVVQFEAVDQYSQPIAATLAITCSGTGIPAPASGATDGTTGQLAVNVTDATAEAVTVTATAGTITGTATTTFVAAS